MRGLPPPLLLLPPLLLAMCGASLCLPGPADLGHRMLNNPLVWIAMEREWEIGAHAASAASCSWPCRGGGVLLWPSAGVAGWDYREPAGSRRACGVRNGWC